MNQELEVYVNDPFDGSFLKDLFQTPEDMKLANPYASFPYKEAEWIETFSKTPDSCSLIFRLNGAIVGHTSFLPREDDLYLCYVILHPDYRGRNFASEMIKLSEEFSRLNYPHHELLLNVNRGNERARKLYLNQGYEIFAEESDRFKMKKSLILGHI